MGDAPVTQASLDATLEKFTEKVFGKINDLSKKLDVEIGNVNQETARLNIQTQVLEKKGRFDSSSSSAGGADGDRGGPPAQGPKFRYPKYDGSEDRLAA